MTTEAAAAQVPLARSWIYPPSLKVIAGPFTNNGYDYGQRAYFLARTDSGSNLKLEVAASDQSPLLNPCFVIQDWGERRAKLKINGQVFPVGKDLRLGHRDRLEGRDLIVWLKTRSAQPLLIELKGSI
jgi:hypothetical protein